MAIIKILANKKSEAVLCAKLKEMQVSYMFEEDQKYLAVYVETDNIRETKWKIQMTCTAIFCAKENVYFDNGNLPDSGEWKFYARKETWKKLEN